MLNNFENNFNTLIMETISDAQVRLEEQNPEYKQQSIRMSEIYDELKFWQKDKDFQPTPYHWDLVYEYYQLSLGTYLPEHTATYVQAIVDCVSLLAKLGLLKN